MCDHSMNRDCCGAALKHLSSHPAFSSTVKALFHFSFRDVVMVLFFLLLQDGIKPMWEDDRNKLGGRWLMTLNKQQRHNDLDRFWMETVRERL